MLAKARSNQTTLSCSHQKFRQKNIQKTTYLIDFGSSWSQSQVKFRLYRIGSFFYGNSFGTNYELFPFIASKGNRNILFEKSRFSKDVKAKESTARVVLGNMIK